MPRQQASLDAFFKAKQGEGNNRAGGLKQTKLPFAKTNNTAKNKKQQQQKQKRKRGISTSKKDKKFENSTKKQKEEKEEEEEDETTPSTPPLKPEEQNHRQQEQHQKQKKDQKETEKNGEKTIKTNGKREAMMKKRRVFQDDSSDEEENEREMAESKQDNNEETGEEMPPQNQQEDEDTKQKEDQTKDKVKEEGEEEEKQEQGKETKINNKDDEDNDKDNDEKKKKKQKSPTKTKNADTKTVSGSKRSVQHLLSFPTSPKSSPKRPKSASFIKKATNQATSKNKTSPKNNTQKQDSLSYLELCECFEQIEAITARLEIQQLLTTLLTKIFASSGDNARQDLNHVLYLASNTVAPSYDCIELGIGDALLIKAIGEAYGTNPALVKQKYKAQGDLGTVAKISKGKQQTLNFGAKPKRLTVKDVLATFRDIAKTTGAQSQTFKVNKIKSLLVRAQGPEAKYIIRGLQGKLRIGLARSTVLISLAHALAQRQGKTKQNDNKKAASNKDNDEDDNDDEEEDMEEDEEENGEEDMDEDDKDKETAGTEEKIDDVDEDGDVEMKEEEDIPEVATRYKRSKGSERLEAAVAIIKQAYSEVPSYDSLLDAALRVPLEELYKACTLTPGIPVEPMLAKPTKSIQDVLKRLEGNRFTCEYKYDGERAQVHMMADGTTKVFSRNLLDTSVKFPEVPLYVKQACGSNATSFVLDTEVVAFSRETQTLVPFQVLSTRKKKTEDDSDVTVQVIVQAFDLVYLNGVSLLAKSLEERRRLLREHFSEVPQKFQFAKFMDHCFGNKNKKIKKGKKKKDDSEDDGDDDEVGDESTTRLEEFLDTAVKGQCEGLMIKTLDDAYEPSKRSLNWLKLKKDYLNNGGLGDSLDLVPLGGYFGRGKRTGVFGAYLLACFDPETEQYQSVCKIGTGFSDEDLEALSKSFEGQVCDTKNDLYHTSDALECDAWFKEPTQVWEIKAADLSLSSAHKGAFGRCGEAGRGIGLRFPRFERVRPDKKPADASTSNLILELYQDQDTVKAGKTNNGEDDDDDEDDGI